MSSIRGKITLGYLALALGVGGFVLFASADLRFLETRVREGVAISAFQETAQEMRRHEKNYFLYRGADELDEARAQAGRLAQQLDAEAQALASIARNDEIPALGRAIERYRKLIEQPIEFVAGNAEANHVEADIRAAGHEISEFSEHLALRERTALVATLRQSRHALFWSVGLVALLALAGGQLLYRAVGRPLRRLEEQLEPMAEGRFQTFSMVSEDREIVSFTAALNRMLKELELGRRQVLQSDKLAALGTLASGVAHELNNPLGNISGACQILLEELDGLDTLPADARAALRDWLTQIDDETERARRIVRTLLDYSRKPVLAGAACLLGEALEKSLLLLRQRLPNENSVGFELPADLLVCADPQRLQQVFINLIQNALDAGGDSVQVNIHARQAEAANWPPAGAGLVVGARADREAVLVTVADDGPGIPGERLGHIFDPFFTTREPGEGTGLGLYIVGEIVQELGGAIAVSSPGPSGRGVSFSLWLPCGAAA
jgi:signal transduction histidine kinase